MGKELEYALWLVPPAKISRKLKRIISENAARYSSPDFSPHITLLGGFRGNKKDINFHCAFIKVRKTPELMKSRHPKDWHVIRRFRLK